MKGIRTALWSASLGVGLVTVSAAQEPGSVRKAHKLEGVDLGASDPLENGDGFGGALQVLGDLDRDGVVDLAVGAPGSNVLGLDDSGSLHVLFLHDDGRARETIQVTTAALGDVNGDGYDDV